MRAKLAVYEAERVPFSPEELALLESGVDETLLSEGPAQSTRTLSMDQGADMDRLEREATQAIDANDFAEYPATLQILKFCWITLPFYPPGVCEMQLEDSTWLRHACKKFRSGQLRQRSCCWACCRLKQNPEEALNHLSKGAAIQPENPQIQNQLGVVLSELGQREAAETAFRKLWHCNPVTPKRTLIWRWFTPVRSLLLPNWPCIITNWRWMRALQEPRLDVYSARYALMLEHLRAKHGNLNGPGLQPIPDHP